MTVVARKESGSRVAMPHNKGLRYMSYEDTLREMEAFLDGKIYHPQSIQDVYADVTEPMSSNITRLLDNQDPEATENSSSFDDTTSRSENASGISDAEVESEFRVDSGLLAMLDGYSNVFPMRKKRLTTHWRSLIRPVMWRCKWTELRIKELESQASKYSREIEVNDQTKLLELQQHTPDFCSKSSPFVNHLVKRKLMRRRKRKHVENMTDISSYMSHHQPFSYFENNKFNPEGTSTADDADVQCKNDEFSMDDDWLKNGEDSFEPVLRQIETVQSQVHGLRTQLAMVMLKNGVKFSSSENFSLLGPYDAQTSACQSPAFSVGNGDTMSIGAIYVSSEQTEFEIGNVKLPEGTVSGYEEIPDIIESTVGLLSAADVSIHQTRIVEFGENNLDDALMQNHATQNGHMCNRVTDQSSTEKKEPSGWVLDSGCTVHASGDRNLFFTYSIVDNASTIKMGNGTTSKIVGIGDMKIKGHDGRINTLTKVRHVVGLKHNLISLNALEEKGFDYMAIGGVLEVKKGKEVVLRAIKQKKLYTLIGSTIRPPSSLKASTEQGSGVATLSDN